MCVNIAIHAFSFYVSCICSHSRTECHRIRRFGCEKSAPFSIYWRRTLIYSFSSKIQLMSLSFLPFPVSLTVCLPSKLLNTRQEMIISSIILSALVGEIYKDILVQITFWILGCMCCFATREIEFFFSSLSVVVF